MRRKLVAVVLITLLVAACQPNPPANPTPEPQPTLRGAIVPTRIPTETVTPSPTPTITPTDTPTQTESPTPSNTPTETPTNTPSNTPTNTPTDTPSPTDEPTEEPTSAVEDLLTQAETFLNNSQYTRAIEAYTAILEMEPENVNALMNRGFAYFQLEDNEAALTDFQQVIAINPEDATAFYNVGYILNERGDYEAALEALDQSLSLEPGDLDTRIQRADSLYFLGRYDEALADYSAIIESDPNSTTAISNRGYTNARLGDLDSACDDFRRFVEVAGEAADADVTALSVACDDGQDIRPLIGISTTGEIIAIPAEPEFTYSGEINNANFEVLFQFDGKQGEVIGVQLKVDDGDLDPLLIIRDEAGNELINNDDDPEGTGRDSFIRDYVLPADGKYTIVATRFQQDLGTTTGAFTLSMTHNTDVVSTTPTPSAGEPQPIACEETKPGTITDDAFAVIFTFEGRRGMTFGVQMTATSGDLDAYIRILDADDEILLENDDDPRGTSGDSYLRDARLPAAGAYKIVATRFQEELGSTTGDFELTLTCPTNVG